MVDTSRINIPEGIDFLTWYGPRSNDEVKEKEKELEIKREKEKVIGIVGTTGTVGTPSVVATTDSKAPNRTDGVTKNRYQGPENK